MMATNFYQQLQLRKKNAARNADVMDSMMQDRPTYLRAGSEHHPRFGSDVDANTPQIDKQVYLNNVFEDQKRWQGRKKRKYQALVLSLALLRFSLLGMLELNCEINLFSGLQ